MNEVFALLQALKDFLDESSQELIPSCSQIYSKEDLMLMEPCQKTLETKAEWNEQYVNDWIRLLFKI